jgi:hypothetical protein
MAAWLIWRLNDTWGALGTIAATLLAAWVIGKQFSGFSNGEVTNMWRGRRFVWRRWFS